MSGPTEIRAGRYAANEAAYRRINERIRRFEQSGEHRDPMTFLCECAEGACIDQIRINLDDYRRLRQDSRRFIIAPGHDEPEIEHVVERHVHYWVVEKHVPPEPAGTETNLPCVGSGGPPSQVARGTRPEKQETITGVCPQCGHELVLTDRGLLPWHPKQHDPADQ